MSEHGIDTDWTYMDASVLMSIRLGCGAKGGSLRQIMGAADYIDRAYPTLAELNDALNRLSAARLIFSRKGKFGVTPRAEELFAKAASVGRKGVRSQLRKVERLLDCPICGIELRKVRRRFDFDEAELKKAIREYLDDH